MAEYPFDLDKSLIDFPTKDGVSSWTIREAVEGVQIFGGIGSGKTSGSGSNLALKYLSNGFGGLVLTAKADEKTLWENYCKKMGRLDDLIIVEPRGPHRFDFLEYESNRNSKSAFTDNIVQVLKTVIRASEEKSGGKSDDQFWETALDMLIFNVIDLCILAYGSVSVKNLYQIAQTAPKKGEKRPSQPAPRSFHEAYLLVLKNVDAQIHELMESLPSNQRDQLLEDEGEMENFIAESLPDAALLKFVDQFFAVTYPNIGEKTRSIIEFTFSGFLFRLLKEPVYSLFCKTGSTFQPEDSLKGKIILLNLPVKKYHKVGRDCQVMFKYIWQRAMERRDVTANSRPVFLWADEAQHFLHEYDAEYQATARSSRIATVYLSQNLPNYLANMGGAKSEFKVKSFLGTLGTKIFHSNADIETNQYASSLIGEAYVEDVSNSTTVSGNFSSTKGTSYKLEKMVRPEELVGLKNGGPANNLLVEAYMHRQGRKFPDGWSHKKVTFRQQ